MLTGKNVRSIGYTVYLYRHSVQFCIDFIWKGFELLLTVLFVLMLLICLIVLSGANCDYYEKHLVDAVCSAYTNSEAIN